MFSFFCCSANPIQIFVNFFLHHMGRRKIIWKTHFWGPLLHLTLLNGRYTLRNIPSFTKFDDFRKTNSNNMSSYSALTAYKTGARWARNGVNRLNVPTGCKFFSKTAKRRNSSNRFQFPERWRSWLSPTLVYNQTKDAVLNSCLFRVLQGNRTDSEKLCKLTEWWTL